MYVHDMHVLPVDNSTEKIPFQPDILEGSTTTGNNPKYVNMEIMAKPPGGIERSLTTTTSTHEYTLLWDTLLNNQARLSYCVRILSALLFDVYPLHLFLCTSLKY